MNTTFHHLSPGDSPPRRAFTLVELLTVIAILGLLAAILIPTVGSIRTKADRTASASNLRQWASALLLYAGENKQRIPYEGDEDQPSWSQTKTTAGGRTRGSIPSLPTSGNSRSANSPPARTRGHAPNFVHPLQPRGRAGRAREPPQAPVFLHDELADLFGADPRTRATTSSASTTSPSPRRPFS